MLCDFSVPTIHEQAALAVTSKKTTSIARNFPSLILCQEQHDDFTHLHVAEDKAFQVRFLV